MNTKKCTTCKIDKEYSEFHKQKHGLYGIKSVCKECRKIEKDEYQKRDYVIEKQKGYYQRNKKTIRKRLNEHYWTINGQFHTYKKRAKKGNIEFALTESDCIKYYQANCTYCGSKIKGLGIDRVINSRGYTLDNIVPCCSRCNYMKHTMSKNEFFNHIIAIVKHLKLN